MLLRGPCQTGLGDTARQNCSFAAPGATVFVLLCVYRYSYFLVFTVTEPDIVSTQLNSSVTASQGGDRVEEERRAAILP